MRSEKIEKNNRIKLVLELIGRGVNKPEIIQYLKQTYGIRDKACGELIAKAEEIVSKEFSLEKLEQQYYHLYMKAYNDGNYKLCAEITTLIAKLKIKDFDDSKQVEIKIKFDDNTEI